MEDASIFTNQKTREIHAKYLKEAVDIKGNILLQPLINSSPILNSITFPGGDFAPICAAAKKNGIAVTVGCAELASDRRQHSIFCSSVYIDKSGEVQNVHRLECI